ncbi:MAG: energy transducer TonB, partial [Ectothiorhodospiraceae bacterium]|nr:energy transducer TonB [Ectothiorhodospiraceae bacterium]
PAPPAVHDPDPDPEPDPEPEPEPVPTPAEVEQQLGLEDVPEREDEEPSADEQVAGDPEAEQNYLSWLNEQLQRYREYPRQAQMRRMEGTVEVVFTIETDGRITNARIASSSGHTLLDDAVLRLLERLSPLQKAPETRLEDRRLPVEYRLR